MVKIDRRKLRRLIRESIVENIALKNKDLLSESDHDDRGKMSRRDLFSRFSMQEEEEEELEKLPFKEPEDYSELDDFLSSILEPGMETELDELLSGIQAQKQAVNVDDPPPMTRRSFFQNLGATIAATYIGAKTIPNIVQKILDLADPVLADYVTYTPYTRTGPLQPYTPYDGLSKIQVDMLKHPEKYPEWNGHTWDHAFEQHFNYPGTIQESEFDPFKPINEQ